MLRNLHRLSWRRLGAACLALWFIVITMDPMALHACPMHDGMAGSANESAALTMSLHHSAGDAPASDASPLSHASHASHASHGSQLSHASRQANDDAAPASDHHRSGGHACTCLGQCCATVVPAIATASIIEWSAIVERPALRAGRPDHEFVAAWVDFVLPFSTAPPAYAAV